MHIGMRKALLGASVATLAMALSTQASAQQRRFDIPAQDAASAVTAFGLQADLQISAPTGQLRGVKTPAVQGEMDARAALQVLLAGTGLVVAQDDGRTIVLQMAPQGGSAAGGGAEVEALIVTAQKREEDIQDVPIAISAFSQEDLTRSQVAGGPDLITQVPNMTFTKTNFSSYSIQIRGIGTQAISATTDPAVAVAFNNTPFIRNRFFEQEFYDLERVEVLRGPQGTLYGRNATAGVVNIISAKPQFSFQAKASADVANYGSSRLEGMLNLPLVNGKAALRVAGAWTKRDGYVTNLIDGGQTDGRDLWSARASLRVEPTDWFTANLIYEHFEEHDDRLRTGKQVCHKDVGPAEVNGQPVGTSGNPVFGGGNTIIYWTQGCLPASIYSPDSYQTPNGYALPYGPAAHIIGSPVDDGVDTYASAIQSRNLREIETRIAPEYTASTDTVELQLSFDLPGNLTLASETGFNKDRIFSFQDFNRFATRPHTILETSATPGGIYCDPQLGCSDRLLAADISTARSQQFSQELRLSSDYEGKFNFSAGVNFLRYDTEDKYYVLINTISAVVAYHRPTFEGMPGYSWSLLGKPYGIIQPGSYAEMDVNDIHHLTDEGRNYFLSKNPFNLQSYAVFGEAYYNFSDVLKLTIGLRWTIDKKEAPEIPSWLLAADSYGLPTLKTIRQEWREPSGRLAVDWKPHLSFTDETLLYASYVHGYKAGGANPPPFVPAFPNVGGISATDPIGQAFIRESVTHPATFAPEFVDAYEIGTKNTLLGDKLTFNINGFYYDYTGYQISQIVDRSAINLNFDAKIWGSEIEMEYRPFENLRLGFKGGYENTRVADGEEAVDLIDRTAGDLRYMVKKSFPTFPSNCIVPADWALLVDCVGYKYGVDPVTGLPIDPATGLAYVANPQVKRAPNGDVVPLPEAWAGYPGVDPRTIPNNGEGVSKDLSGHQLPNAPKFTATLTADYTLPLPNEWLLTLHTDLYYQAEAWTRIFNTPGYDKLKAYNNINFAAIFNNEERGWTVMAYVKNALDKDNITGSFLNSDDTGLTTNVFLNEPRLYGLRVTKAWTGSEWWSGHANTSGHYPFSVELNGYYGRTSGGRDLFIPALAAQFSQDKPYPLGVQNDLDWGAAGGVKFTYQPTAGGWWTSAGVQYGRTRGGAEEHPQWKGGGYLIDPAALEVTKEAYPDLVASGYLRSILYVGWDTKGLSDYATTTARSDESHAIADFEVGKDVGLGLWNSAPAHVSAGLQYAKLRSSSDAELHGQQTHIPAYNIFALGADWDRFLAEFHAQREFEGAGPSISLAQSFELTTLGDPSGRVDVNLGLGGSVLFGRQNTSVESRDLQTHMEDYKYGGGGGEKTNNTTVLSYRRSSSVTVPSLNANLGLSYTAGGLKLSGGYRWERYFDAIDAGVATRKTYDRQFDGPYFKVSIGFGG